MNVSRQLTMGRAGAFGLAGAAATAVLIGVPTVVVPNPFFTRMTPTRPQDYLFLAVTAILTGLLAATYALPATCPLQEGKVASGGLLSFLAVGCPVCNKIVVLLIGASGALAWFEPLQPPLALASIALLSYVLAGRVRELRRVGALRPQR